MTALQLPPRTDVRVPPRTAVRAARLVDVPAVVRLFAPPPASLRPSVPSPDGAALGRTSAGRTSVDRAAVDGAAVNWEQAQRAMRVMLAHHALEEGQVWVAERADGALLAAGIWLPPGVGTELPDTGVRSLLAREISICPPEHPVLSTALKAAGPDGPHWTVVTVCTPDDTEAWDRTVVAELLAPGLRAVDDEAATAVAITVSASHVDQLRSLGFRGPREVPVAPGASVWLTTRQSKSRPRLHR